MKCLKLLAAAAFFASSAPAFAQFYAFAGAGGGNPTFNSSDFPFGGPINFRRNDTKDVTYHVGLGYRFSRHWALEVGAADLGDYSIHLADTFGDSIVGTYKVRGFKTALVGSWPLAESFSVYAKLGLATTKAQFEANTVFFGLPGTLDADERRNSVLAGFGMQYNFTPHIGVRAEFENWGEVGNETGTGRAKMATWNLLGVFSF